ncbi:MAG: D-alanyl-D-alanine carboxypeptidase/D-alanyl-D-alanine-endopeptidase [Thermoprotei archaeon]|nr:MAG: D-alanyl-D-alanine carboxypeptidase/D-alanyl-D-alanine-endopeptidase [Thermoprotei archaeon]
MSIWLKPLIDDLKGADVGIVVADENQNKLIEINPDNPFIPASNMKLFTAAAALLYLRPNFRYFTGIYYTGSLDGGTLKGNIVVRGSGDPLLKSTDIDKVSIKLSRVLKQVKGNIIVDTSVFDREFVNKRWDENYLQHPYAPRVSALTVNEGCINIIVQPTQPGEKPLLEIHPIQDEIRIINKAITVKKGFATKINVTKKKGENVFIVEGTIEEDAYPVDVKKPIENPHLYTGSLFKSGLIKNGVSVEGNVEEGFLEDGVLLDYIVSNPLTEIVKKLLKHSDNLVAECLLKTMGYYRYGKGSWANGINCLKRTLGDIGLNLDDDNIRIFDGSGLSKSNKLTPWKIVELLLAMRKSSLFKYFYNALPVAGVDGTLRKRMRNTPAERRVIAKTGTLSNACTLSGYIKTLSGRELVFSIMVNNFEIPIEDVRKIIDKICVNIVKKY